MSDPKFVAETPQDRERRLTEKPVAQVTTPIDITSYINVYEFETTLPGNGQEIKFKPVTTGQMKKLLVYEQSDSPSEIEKALDGLITECVISPDFDINKLYLQDRFYLLLQIRSKTKGDMYTFHWTCPVCKTSQPAGTNISELETKPPKEKTTWVQINDNLRAEFEFPTRGMQDRAIEHVSKLEGLSENERLYETALYTYALCLGTFETPVGKTQPSLEDKYTVLNSVGTDIIEGIQVWMNDNNFGVDFELDVKCINPDCAFEHNMDIPISDFFV